MATNTITMDFEQALDFFGTVDAAKLPGNVVVLPRAEVDAQIAALVTASDAAKELQTLAALREDAARAERIFNRAVARRRHARNAATFEDSNEEVLRLRRVYLDAANAVADFAELITR